MLRYHCLSVAFVKYIIILEHNMNDIIDADRQEMKCSDCMSKSIELTNLLKHLTNLCLSA